MIFFHIHYALIIKKKQKETTIHSYINISKKYKNKFKKIKLQKLLILQGSGLQLNAAYQKKVKKSY